MHNSKELTDLHLHKINELEKINALQEELIDLLTQDNSAAKKYIEILERQLMIQDYALIRKQEEQ